MAKQNSKELATRDSSSSVALSLNDQLKGAEQFVEMVSNSPVLSKNFPKDSNGEVDRGAVLTAIVLGNEMGIPPAASIMLGRKLDKNAYFAVMKGKSMGLDPITSINKIYNISTSNGDVIALAVDLVSKAILDSGTKIEYVRDFMAVPMYFDVISGAYIGHKFNVYDEKGVLNSNYHIMQGKDKLTDEDEKAKEDGKTFIKKGKNLTFVTSVRLIRPSHNIDQIFHYSLQEAIEAKLYRGFSVTLVDAKNKPMYTEGRPNWNTHPATMLRNRVTSIGGRIVAADVLQGSYSVDEVKDMGYDTDTIEISDE